MSDSNVIIENPHTVQKASDAAAIREWLRLPAYQIFEARMKREVKIGMDKWFAAETPEVAEAIRQSCKPLHALQLLLKKIMMEGDLAEKQLALKREENNLS